MSAITPRADIQRGLPISAKCQNGPYVLFDHLIGAGE
jgi:hypothetical protein